MSLLDDVIGKAETLLQELKDASATLDASAQIDAADTAPAVAAVPDLPAAEPVATGEPAAHDNELPFKCPACGATYETQVVCQIEHPPEATLPTADVLAGAEPGGAATAASGTGEDPPVAVAAPAGEGASSSSSSSSDPAPPQWPA